MVKRKKKEDSILEDMTPALTFAGGAMGASILGGAMESYLPAGMTNPLTTTGRTMGTFVGPMATIGVMGITTKQLKKLESKIKKVKK